MKTIRVNVTVMINVNENEDVLNQVYDTFDTINNIVGISELNSNPVILTSDITNSDINDVE